MMRMGGDFYQMFHEFELDRINRNRTSTPKQVADEERRTYEIWELKQEVDSESQDLIEDRPFEHTRRTYEISSLRWEPIAEPKKGLLLRALGSLRRSWGMETL